MEGGYILTKDLPAERTASQFAGLRTSKKAVNALRGELLVAIRGEDLIPRNDGAKPHNYRLERDMTVTLRAEEDEVAPLDLRDFLLLEAIKSTHSRFDTFIYAYKMEWGLSLKEGSEVFVAVNPEMPHHSWLRSRAAVCWVGELGGSERGTVFGVEIMDEAHRGQGTTDGTFSGKRYFACANDCGMFVALDKLSRDREGNDLAAPPPSGQQYGGQGPSQQEPSRPVTRSAAAAAQREAQRSGGRSQQTVKKEERVAVESKEQPRFRIKDRVVVYTKKNTPVHGIVRWTGRCNHPELPGFVIGIETDAPVRKDEFPDALPDSSNIIHPDRKHGKVFLLEPFVTLESERAQAVAEKKKTFQGGSTCTDVDAKQFDTTQAEQVEAMKQVEKGIAEAAGFPKDVVEDFDQQTEELERLRLEKEERDRNKVAQTPSTADIPRATLPPFDRQHSAGSLEQPSPQLRLPHSQSVDPNSRGSSQLAHSQSVDTNYDGGGPVPGLEQQRGQAGERRAVLSHDDYYRQRANDGAVRPPGNPVRQDPALQEDTYHHSYYPASQQPPPHPSSEQPHGHPQHQQRAGQPPPQQQLEPAGSSHQSHGQQTPPTCRDIQVIAPTPRDHDPTRILGIGSMVQVSDPPRYGVLRWIGELPDVKGAIGGVEMEETMQGCTDGSWKGTQCFQCQPGRGFFCPLSAVRPDGRFTPVGETPRGVTAIPNPLAHWPMSEMADQIALDIDVERYLGEGHGIQGNQNSCYLDATVFGLFAVSDVFDQLFLLNDDADKDAKEIADILWKGIVNPLRKNGVVRMESVMKMRDKLEKIGMMKGVNQDEKDPEEFLNMLFKHVLHVEPFITIKRPFGVEQEYFVQLFLEFDEKVEIPTVGSLLRKMFLEQDISFTEAPSQLLIQVPRFGKKFKTYDKIIPELLLDVGELLPSSYNCIICGEPARMKCDVCQSRFMSEDQDSSVYLCSTCDKRAHKSPETQRHARVKVFSPSCLKLLSVICIETSHYVCFTRADDERWIFLDSMANRVYDQYNIPRGVDCTRLLNEWVYTEDQSRLLSTPSREMPEFVRRFTQDIYMCVYINPDVSMY